MFRYIAVFQREVVEDICILAIPPPRSCRYRKNGQAPTAEEISLLEIVDVHIAKEAGVTVVSVLIGIEDNVLDQASEVVKGGGPDRPARRPRCPANTPVNQAAALIAIESQGPRKSYIGRALDTGLSLEACRRADKRVQWAHKKILQQAGAAVAPSFSRRGAQQTIG